jgi:hypothetical protein
MHPENRPEFTYVSKNLAPHNISASALVVTQYHVYLKNFHDLEIYIIPTMKPESTIGRTYVYIGLIFIPTYMENY